jgi:ATP-binding cassette subfamily B protein
VSAGRVAGRVIRREPAAYAIAWTSWVIFHALPIPAGLLLRAVLDRVPADSGDAVWVALAALAGLELGRWCLFAFNVVQFHGCWVFWHTLPRVNVLRSLVGAPGPVAGRLPGSSGEAVSRFRDDAQNLAMVLDVWLDISGALVASASALLVMASVDARITFVVAVPVLAALGLCHWLGHRLRMWRRHEREATAALTGFIGDAFGAIGTVKLTGAGSAVADRFAALGDVRAEAARRDQVATQVLQTTSSAVGDLGTGLVLLLLVPALARADVSVGDVGVFATAVVVLAGLPRWVARYGAIVRQGDVSVDRLAELLPGREPEGLTLPTGTDLRHGPGPLRSPASTGIGPAAGPTPPAPSAAPLPTPTTTPAPTPTRTPALTPASALAHAASVPAASGGGANALDQRRPRRLRRLEARGLTVDHGGGGIHGVDLVVERGTVTVVTGPVGSGKSTLLRALLGLVGRDAGEIRWNGDPVDDPGRVLVPPRAAYVAQTPRLFSEPLSDAVLLGVDPAGLAEAIELSCLDDDVARMPEGLATVVGARGVRLSGGQVQRTATARALVRRPELLVVDDLSSALDVQTEARLWAQLLDADHPGRPGALLVVSHRPAVIARADQVVTLDAGRVLA